MSRTRIPVFGLAVVIVTASLMSVLSQTSENAIAGSDVQEPEIFSQTISNLVENVSASNIYSYIYDLQNFTTRFYATTNINQSATYISSHFSNSTNLFVESQYFNYSGYLIRNVVATIPAFNPNNKSVYIMGGHYDSICLTNCIGGQNSYADPYTPAPGADDDASGTSVVMEAARVMSKYKYNATIVFAAWTAEEIGLVGSNYYATNAADSGMDVEGMLQFDMVGNHAGGPFEIEVTTNVPSQWIADEMIEASLDYSLGLTVTKIVNPGAGASDHASFWAQGYDAAMIAESDFSPHWHRPTDTIDNINITLIERTTKAGVAALAKVAGIITPGVGEVVLDKLQYKVTDTVGITLVDNDLNLDPGALDGATVTAISDSEPGYYSRGTRGHPRRYHHSHL
jgi:hypothetical protein